MANLVSADTSYEGKGVSIYDLNGGNLGTEIYSTQIGYAFAQTDATVSTTQQTSISSQIGGWEDDAIVTFQSCLLTDSASQDFTCFYYNFCLTGGYEVLIYQTDDPYPGSTTQRNERDLSRDYLS